VIVDAIVDRMGWMDNGLINASIASDEVEMGRPYPLMINTLMNDLGISSAAEVIKTGDTMVDIQEGRMAGCGLVIGITTGAYTYDELAEYAPDHIINNLLDLKQLL
jgi:phosphoglycolate phosphatase-like HAD superfamily hydrolase